MFYRNSKNLSYLLSIAVHILLALLFFFFRFPLEPGEDEFVTVGFGDVGTAGTSGAVGFNEKSVEETPKQEAQKEEPKKVEKKVELPKTVNTDEDNIALNETEKKEEEAPKPKVKPLNKEQEETSKGKELLGQGESSFGFEIDFGGKGKRKIYSYILPSYPEGVSKEIDVKLRFSILPDGTVGNIFPMIKADAKLEMAAINSLRQWRFEPLPPNQKQMEQSAVIVFPYRLQ